MRYDQDKSAEDNHYAIQFHVACCQHYARRRAGLCHSANVALTFIQIASAMGSVVAAISSAPKWVQIVAPVLVAAANAWQQVAKYGESRKFYQGKSEEYADFMVKLNDCDRNDVCAVRKIANDVALVDTRGEGSFRERVMDRAYNDEVRARGLPKQEGIRISILGWIASYIP